jgi:hydrogenase-4 component B
VPGLALGRRSSLGQAAASALSLAAAAAGLGAALVALARGGLETARLAGPLPDLALHLRLDALSAFFLAPVWLLGATATVYGARYWSQAEHPENARGLRLWLGVLVASLAAVVLAADAIAFLIAWEIMTLAAFLLVTTEDERGDVQQAGWVYLVAAHASVLVLFAFFGLAWAATGSLELRPLAGGGPVPAGAGVLFLLALVGFGLKAGIVPLHFWLPAAHANAPSHVSALLSGVVLKLGIYGLLRTLTLLPAPPPSVGVLLLALGAASALYGVLFALGQHDLKRLLAYHSVENVGIIVMGLGLALIGVGARQPAWAALGLAGCLLHVWNHALFKSLLFLAAGSVIHATGTREIDRLGGLARPMAGTAALFAVGAAAICGLPPLNGFASELLIFVGLLRVTADGVGGVWSVAPLAAPLLALAGALALACFVKAFGTVFLGAGRSEAAARAHESPLAMRGAMGALALGCAGIGLLPVLVMPALDAVVRAWLPLDPPPPSLAALVPWAPLMALNGALVGGLAAAALLLRARSRRRPSPRTVTWDCGYARPSPRMAYTASSFAQILVGLFGWLLQPRFESAVASELFPARRHFHVSVPEQVLDGVLAPLWTGFRRALVPLRALQHGRIQRYLMVVFLTLCALLAFQVPLDRLLARLFAW